MTELEVGKSALLGDGNPSAVVVDVHWKGGTVPCELAAFMCGEAGRVLSDAHFVFYNQQRSAGGGLVHRSHPPDAPIRAQLQIHLASFAPQVVRVDMALTALNRDLDPVSEMSLTLWDPHSGDDMLTYSIAELGTSRTSLIGRLDRTHKGWTFLATNTGHDRDLRAVAQLYGVSV